MDWELTFQFFKEIVLKLYAHYSLFTVILMVGIMSLIVGILVLIKKPIKLLTGKIQNEKLRKLANKSLIIIALGISILIWYILHWIAPNYIPVDWVQIFLTWTLSQTAYALGDGIIPKSKAKNLVEEIIDDIKDGSVEKEEIKEFYDKVK